MLTAGREVGKTYIVDDGFELPPLTPLVAGADSRTDNDVAPVSESEPVRQRLTATYFDTADLRLATAGLTLRRRTGGDDAGWHLSVPVGSGARTHVREPLGRGSKTVPTRLQQMVWARTMGAPLQPIAQVTTERTLRRIVDVTGHSLLDVADDRITARRLTQREGGSGAATGAAASWREIEVIDGDGDGDADLLSVVDARLREHGLLESPSASKLAQALDLPGGDGAATATKGERLTVKTPGGAALLGHVREQVQQIQAQDLPVRLDAPDSIHKMRVATRRLRSALTTFKPLFAAEVVRPLRGELKWLAGELGAARDAEVMRDRVRKAVASESPAGGPDPAAAAADAELDQAYRTAHDRVLAELDGDRYHAILTSLETLVGTPPLTERAATAAGKTHPRLVARSYATVRRLVEEADAKPPGAEREELLHDARKAAKQARYAGESVSRIFGKDAIAFAEAMEGVQEALGEHQDSILTRERLRDLALNTSDTGAAFLYGRLYAMEEAQAQDSRQHFDAAWKAARRKSVHRWLA